jgi:2-isopropylmalate synthase
VGYALPFEFAELISALRRNVPQTEEILLSVHCHNDLGLAVANSLNALTQGVRQVECTINGIGERAGNAALEEIVMSLYIRKSVFNLETNINIREIYKTSRLVSSLTGISVQPNKAIVGGNAFAHEAGIHQDGVLKSRLTYEIITPQSVGVPESTLVLGKHSGRHAFKKRLKELGCFLPEELFEKVFSNFKKLADKKKYIYNEDILALVEEESASLTQEFLHLEYLHTNSGAGVIPTATLRIKKGGKIFQEAACGDGPVDAAYKAIDKIVGLKFKLVDYSLRAISGGKDALGEVIVQVERGKQVIFGRATSTDIIEASVKAYLNALNKFFAAKRKKREER